MKRAGEHDLPSPAAALLSGAQQTPEFERFLERAERDPAASAELDFLADLVAAAELERARLAGPVRSAPRRRPARTLLALAAAAALVVAGWFVLDRAREPRFDELAERSAPRYIPSDLRAADAPLAAELARTMEPYTRGDFAAAARALDALLERAPEHATARFYLAAALEALGELDRAEEHYRRVAAGEDYLAEHAAWRLANLRLARGDVAGARAELERLQARGAAFAPNAAALLAELRER